MSDRKSKKEEEPQKGTLIVSQQVTEIHGSHIVVSVELEDGTVIHGIRLPRS